MIGVRALQAALYAVASLPPAVHRALAGRPVRIDGQTLEPHVQVAVRALERIGGPGLEARSVADARASLRQEARVFGGRPPAIARVEDRRDGPVPARLYVAPGPPPEDLLVFYHGGGWVVGDLESHDAPCRFLARAAGVAVLSVDYRLAPEHRFPAAVGDALAAFRHAATLGYRRVGVGGDSAGGNLAAVVAALAHDDGGPEPAFQALVYPGTDFVGDYRSTALFGEGFFLTRPEMDWYRDHYLPPGDERAPADPRASPLRRDDLSGLAPAYVATAGFDPIRDEGEAYARRLRDSGVPVVLRRHSGLVHGWLNAVGLPRRHRQPHEELAAAIRWGLAERP